MRRRALRVMRPAREKKRRRRVLVVASGSPRPRHVVQRARLWAMTPHQMRGRLWTASQAAMHSPPANAARLAGNLLGPRARVMLRCLFACGVAA